MFAYDYNPDRILWVVNQAHLQRPGIWRVFLYLDHGEMEWKLDILGGEYRWYISLFCDNCEETTAFLGITNIYAAFIGNEHFFPNGWRSDINYFANKSLISIDFYCHYILWLIFIPFFPQINLKWIRWTRERNHWRLLHFVVEFGAPVPPRNEATWR